MQFSQQQPILSVTPPDNQLDPFFDKNTALSLKDAHQEWKIFREKQLSHIDRYLWNKVIESIVGYKLTNPSVRVPSLNRELYDIRYLTDTQYGIRDGQTFTNGKVALQTVLADLQNPDIDFHPIDIDAFFSLYSFDIPTNIIAAMDIIYNTFPYNHVNRIFFSVLHDAFSVKNKYEDIFKTSMIALHGIRPFQEMGQFDD